MKFCKDCKHYRPEMVFSSSAVWAYKGVVEMKYSPSADSSLHKCARRVSPIDGEPDITCRAMRGGPSAIETVGQCGPDGALWEPA